MFEQYTESNDTDSTADARDPDATADACGDPPIASNNGRSIILIVAFLTFMPGSLILYFWLGDRPGGIQFASMIGYTGATILYTFSANRGMQRYLFDCPYVRSQFRPLALRHLGFLAALVLLQTALLSLRPHLSPWWFVESIGSRDMPPVYLLIAIPCGALLYGEIMTNRSLLKRAHPDANSV
jgi:hypothetical protein